VSVLPSSALAALKVRSRVVEAVALAPAARLVLNVSPMILPTSVRTLQSRRANRPSLLGGVVPDIDDVLGCFDALLFIAPEPAVPD